MENSKKPIDIWVKERGIEMVRRNKEIRSSFSAKIKIDGKDFYGKGEEEQFIKKIEEISDPVKQSDALHLLVCLQVGRMVEVENEKIKLHYWTRRYRPMMVISENPELVFLLKELVHS